MKGISNNPDMHGQVCMVTGATSGIGRATATALARQGARLVITGRNEAKTQRIVDEIQDETSSKTIDYLLADYCDLRQVRSLAEAFQDRYTRLDVLVNNAGVFLNTRRETPYGVEQTFLVNHLAPFVLTNLLLDRLLTSAPARIVNVSSDAHRQGTMDLSDLNYQHGFAGIKAYARSKLATVLFTYELSRRLDSSGVTVNALHPGHVATGMWRTGFPILGPLIGWLMARMAMTPEQGADNSVYLASSPEVAGVTGKYFVKREAVPSAPLSYDVDLARELWQASTRLTGDPGS